MRVVIFYIYAIASIFLSCSNEKELDEQVLLSYFYNETQCNDPWESGETLQEKKSQVEKYLTDRSIEFVSLKATENKNNSEVCLACTCKTGVQFVIEIDKTFSAEIAEIGFQIIE